MRGIGHYAQPSSRMVTPGAKKSGGPCSTLTVTSLCMMKAALKFEKTKVRCKVASFIKRKHFIDCQQSHLEKKPAYPDALNTD